MFSAIARSGITLALAVLLQSCGGGGGGGGAGNPPPGGSSGPRVSASTTSVSAAATPGQDSPVGQVALTVANPPAGGVFVEGGYSTNGISTVDLIPASATQATLHIVFRTPGSLQNGTYADTIQLRFCREQPCVTEIAGSPLTVTTSYVVSGTGTSSAAIDRTAILVGVNEDDTLNRVSTLFLTISPAPVSGIYLQTSNTSAGIQSVTSQPLAAGAFAEVRITFQSGQQLGNGTYRDTVNITVCYDSSCVRQLQGSPFAVSTTFTVGAVPEPGVTPLEVASRVALPHDVIDAEFSKALNAIVMVGNYPVSALYVHDVSTGNERQQLLDAIPTAVSISPDGRTAAVGHEASITIVDLMAVGQPGAPAPVILDVGTDAGDFILDGNGYVHALPRLGGWQRIHTVQIATNTEQLSTGTQIHSGAHGRLHPSGDYLYTAASITIAPADIEKWDVRSGPAAWLYDSPYHGEYGMCGDLWFSEDGISIYTVCGDVFRASEVRAQDMVQSGALQLSPSVIPFRIRSLSQSDSSNEIVLIEYDYYICDIAPSAGQCYEHLVFYEDDFLDRQAVYGIGPVTINGSPYAQQGLFVFHDAVGTNKYLLSKLKGMPNPDAEYYLSVVP
jgi:hypothetical protein